MKWAFWILLLLTVLTFILIQACTKEFSCEGCLPTNKPPIANAGADKAISLPINSTFLDGSLSNDPDGKITKWRWAKLSGPPSFAFLQKDSAKTSVQNLVQGMYQFEITVEDDEGANARDTLQITVRYNNHPPVACAGADLIITLPVTTAMLDGTCSNDADNDITNYSWTKISGLSAISIENGNTAQPEIQNLAEGTYLFELKVIDAGGLISLDTVQVFVKSDNEIVDVFIAGEENGVAKYWKNGQPVSLSSSTPLEGTTAYSIVVVGNDVYVAGFEYEFLAGSNRARYWKNGQEVFLTGYSGGDAYSITVSSGDVYVAGIEGNRATYWKNGQAVRLGNVRSYARSVIIAGGDVYIAGAESLGNSIEYSKYWKNGQAVLLPNGHHASAIAVMGNDVYVAGYVTLTGLQPGAKYWKNGQEINLYNGSTQSEATSIAINGGDVYIAGYRDQKAVYWKNGKPVSLTNGPYSASANSIAIYRGDVYVAGSEILPNGTRVAKYWKNGREVLLSNGPGIADAYSIFIVPR